MPFGFSKRNPRPGPDVGIPAEQNRRRERRVDPAAESHALRHERQILQEQQRLVLRSSLRVDAERNRNVLVQKLRLHPPLAAARQEQIEIVDEHRPLSGLLRQHVEQAVDVLPRHLGDRHEHRAARHIRHVPVPARVGGKRARKIDAAVLHLHLARLGVRDRARRPTSCARRDAGRRPAAPSAGRSPRRST